MKAWLVGGAVRDQQLGLPVKEKDWVVTGSTPEEMIALGYQPVGKDFPVFLHPQTKEEYALARTERKSGRGYHGFVFNAAPDVTLEEDLARRDLTINAIAQDDDGRLVDPFGGLQDLEKRCLRHVSPAFAEDPLRVIRVARFAARFHHLGFSIDPETLLLMQQLVDEGEVRELVPERLFAETRKALVTDAPQIFFRSLRDCGALQDCFPELDRQFGIPQPEKHHPEIDCGEHTLLAIEQSAVMQTSEQVRFAVLCHDFGKGITSKAILPSHRGHEKAGLPLVKDFCERIRAPKAWRELALLVTAEHLNVHRALEMRPQTLEKLLSRADAWRRPERFDEFLQACEADARGRLGLASKPYPQANFLRQLQAATMGIRPGPGIEPRQIPKNLVEQRVQRITAEKQRYLAAL